MNTFAMFSFTMKRICKTANGSRYRRRVGLDSFAKRKCSKPEPTDFDGVNPAVLVHAVLGAV
jgi:hypothetical protein